MWTWWQRLEQARRDKGWTKRELAERSGVDYQRVVKYTNGEVDQPRGNALDRLARAFGRSRLWLQFGERYEQQQGATGGGPGLAGDAYRAPGSTPTLSFVDDDDLFAELAAGLAEIHKSLGLSADAAKIAKVAFQEWPDITAASRTPEERRANTRFVLQRHRRWLIEHRNEILDDDQPPPKKGPGTRARPQGRARVRGGMGARRR
ncbi:MAG: helix-turn-helix transcriptional regulator [Rhodospirillales bacterium]|nr:helix-turn-helix transcriptional regulator [Rhodospirillales bacterium]